MRLTEEPPKTRNYMVYQNSYVCIYLSNILIIKNNLYAISLNRYIFLLLPYGT